jgi:hypothetical protein
LACLPAAGHDDRAVHGRALHAVDVLRVAEPDRCEVFAGEGALLACAVELDDRRTAVGDVENFAVAPVLDAWLAGRVVRFDERDPVALAYAVVDAGDLGLGVSEFAAFGTVVLRSGV